MPFALIYVHTSSFKQQAVFLQWFNRRGVMHEAAGSIYKPMIVNNHLCKYVLMTRAS